MTITINQTMQGLLIRDGSIVRTLGTGTYRTSIFRNETITTYPAVAQAYGYSVNTRTKEGVTVTIDVTLDTLIDDVRAGDVLMVKGSLGSAMGPLVEALINRFGSEANG